MNVYVCKRETESRLAGVNQTGIGWTAIIGGDLRWRRRTEETQGDLRFVTQHRCGERWMRMYCAAVFAGGRVPPTRSPAIDQRANSASCYLSLSVHQGLWQAAVSTPVLPPLPLPWRYCAYIYAKLCAYYGNSATEGKERLRNETWMRIKRVAVLSTTFGDPICCCIGPAVNRSVTGLVNPRCRLPHVHDLAPLQWSPLL